MMLNDLLISASEPLIDYSRLRLDLSKVRKNGDAQMCTAVRNKRDLLRAVADLARVQVW